MSKILVLNGANLNLLGKREPSIYGFETLVDLEASLRKEFPTQEFDFHQTNSEDELIGYLHEAFEHKLPVVLNPGAFTHYSYALRDACAALTAAGGKLIEVHISNPHTREEFRHNSVISAVATGVIAGFGLNSYRLAVSALTHN
jgi:3-dehydroquinate dehydratase II